MAERRERAELGGAADQDVEPTEALGERSAQLIDRLPGGEIERHQGRAAARGAYPVVDLLERARGARDQDEARALGGETFGQRRAQPPARAGDQRDAVGQTRQAQCSSSISDS